MNGRGGQVKRAHSLASAPATNGDRRRALAVVVVLTLALLVTAPFASRPLAAFPSAIVAYDAAILVLEIITALLLWSLSREAAARSLLALACGYAFTPIVIACHALSFPDAFAAGSVIGGAQTTAWLWMVWHGGFAMFVIAYALLPRDERKPSAVEAEPGGGLAIAATLGLSVLLSALTLFADELLPPLMLGSAYLSPETRGILGAGWVVHLAGILLLVRQTRLRSLLDLWIGVALLASLIDLQLSALLVTGRFQVGFYAGRAYGLVAAFIVLTLLLREAMGLRAQAAHAAEGRQAIERKYRILFDAIDEGFCTFQMIFDDTGRPADFRYIETNEGFEKHAGRRPRRGQTMREVFPEAEHMWLELYAEVTRTGEARRFVDHVAGLDRWYDVYVFPFGEPGSNQLGALFTDVTERRSSEEALRESEERLRLIVENARDYAIFTMDTEARVTDWREGAAAVFGYSRDEIVGCDGDLLYTPEDNAAGEPEKERALAARVGKAPNFRWHVCKDGGRVFIEGVCTALHDAEGNLTGFLKIGRDATERHANEERQRTLLAELQHRVRNTLFVVRSVFTRTLDAGGAIEDIADHFRGRLDALARTQLVVTQNPGGTANLEDLIREELLSVGAGDGPNVSLEGPEIELGTEAAEALGLAAHELTTNSVKYGALKVPQARLTIRWSVMDDGRGGQRVRFTWLEQGVPIVEAGTRREGFGTELITRALPYRLGALTSLEVRPGGIHCTIDLPLRVGDRTGTAASSGSATPLP